jgi:anti-sigma regulatory factor (Ser/Thr protein kinase)
MPDCKSWVTQIRKDIEDSRKARLWQDSVNMLSTVSESIFSRSAHFILELLQNAEDAGSDLGTNRGEIEFRISPERIQVTHNGVPFNDTNVDAICGVRSSKKPEEDWVQIGI